MPSTSLPPATNPAGEPVVGLPGPEVAPEVQVSPQLASGKRQSAALSTRSVQRWFILAVWLTDTLSYVVGLVLGWWLRFGSGWFPGTPTEGSWYNFALAGLAFYPVWVGVHQMYELYEEVRTRNPMDEIVRVLKAAGMSFIGLMVMLFFYRGYEFSRLSVLVFVAAAALLSLNLRLVVRRGQYHLRSTGRDDRRFLAVGVTPEAHAIVNEILEEPGLGYRLVGLVVPHGQEREAPRDSRVPVYPIDQLEQAIEETLASDVFICLPEENDEDKLMDLVSRCDERNTRICVASHLFEVMVQQNPYTDRVCGIPLIVFKERHFGPFRRYMKRAMDIVVSLLLLVVLLPLFLAIAALVKWTSKGPIVFVQSRIGKDGKSFTMYKFRSMYSDTEMYSRRPKHREDPRITPIGRFLRRTSLDELPQLINVLRGEMSLVGPRPEMAFWVENYQPWQRQRLKVMPGLTGLWQVNGRSDLPLQENIEFDVYYVRNQSLTLDMKILVKTLFVVLYGKGAY